ncbi:DNA-binding NarL/FixJ family response regulator [Streptomyces sp. 1114.5]|uniref:LuxR C-terminal-related transcriptional regulator n=1 Tax=unclassified Streptomyces TaxID=2593676 RepID=UPI000BCF296E|nr:MULTISPECIES: response regulator transcription factor [unclassified Streptomyces]RKT17962.1 DNA-binding NarL/FixJ family response regulator [Streptomyces sp. 1114.5]SOB84168.1 DNA-binding response regulator, NarL/FixJ family, contains REC and HTH domains [Streptomyces sp. 1331.2]
MSLSLYRPNGPTDLAGPTVRVLICAASPLLRTGLRTILQRAPGLQPLTEPAGTARIAQVCAAKRPDVVIVDADMPGMENACEVKKLTDTRGTGQPGTILLVRPGDPDRMLDYLRAGARGLILRDGPEADMVHAVRAVAAGNALISPSITAEVVTAMARRLPGPPLHTPPLLHLLTPREQEVLTLIAGGLSNAEMAAELHLSEKTVKFHVSNVLGKLRVRSRAQAMVYARSGHRAAG